MKSVDDLEIEPLERAMLAYRKKLLSGGELTDLDIVMYKVQLDFESKSPLVIAPKHMYEVRLGTVYGREVQ